MGSLGAFLIYGAALITGIVMLGYMLWTIVLPEWQVTQDYQETTARVIAKHLGEESTEQATQYRPEVTIRYEINGVVYEATTYDVLRWYSLSRAEQQELLGQFSVGETYPAWYDPAQPERVVLVRDISWWLWLALLILEYTRGLSPMLEAAGTVIWIVFILDFTLKLALAPDKTDYLKSNWLTALAL